MLIWVFFAATVLFGLIAVYFSYKAETRGVKKDDAKDRDAKRQLYELQVVSALIDKIGYTLNTETVAETIAKTVEDLFELSTVSYAVIADNNTIRMKTFIKENVGDKYVGYLKDIMLTAICQIDDKCSRYTIFKEPNESLPQSDKYAYFDAIPQSYFNIPMIVDNKLIGMINISSKKKGVYQDADMSLLYQIINKADRAVEKLHAVIETEKAKLNSMISSLPSGTIMFSFDRDKVDISVINDAAKEFLDIKGAPDAGEVVRQFGGVDLVNEIKNVIASGHPKQVPDVEINSDRFTLYINPVYLHGTQNIVVVSLIMHEMQVDTKADQVKQDFTNMIVHELRAPASAIKGATNLLLAGGLPKEDENKMIGVISNSAGDMLRTIEDILDFARSQDGKLKINKQMSDLTQLVLEHIEVFSYAAREKNVSIGLSHVGDVPPFLFDPVRIGEVLNNLISNSLKFTPQNGKIEVRISHHDGEVEVQVSDNGVGIPEGEKSILFTKFGQIDNAKKLIKDGTSGLGLYIARQIVESHGGKIWVNSEEGKGTHVFFTLPLITQQEQPAQVVN
jgi:signal transduction histidine kinase